MSDLTARFKAFLWQQHHVDPSAVVVNVVNDRVQSFGVDGNHAHVPGRKIPLTVQFEGTWARQTEFDGITGMHPSQRMG